MPPALDTAARRELYLLIARLFGEEVDTSLYRRLLAAQSDALRWIEPEIAELPDQVAVEVLETEYCRLFVGPNPVCPPFASVARGEALFGGRARTNIDEFLASRGLAVEARARIASPDHVAVVFAVLAEISDPDAARACLCNFVLPWIPSWLSKLEHETERALFRTLARVARAVIDEDQASYLHDPQAALPEVRSNDIIL
jgi:TorA maturation chaperone TorD